MDDMLGLMIRGGTGRDYWINTSGYGLTPALAVKMKEHGMTGAIISLDDWNEERHNHIRQNPGSFRWALEAAENCTKAGLIVCFSVCAHREFVSYENLSKIHLLAKNSGAAFLRILEPRRAGAYKGKDVALSPGQVEIIHRFMLERNTGRKYRSFPVIQFPAYHSAKYGCLGAGNRYLYIDPDGNYNPCPFCRKAVGNALAKTIPEGIALTKVAGCHAYKQRV
jgi:MoaA/NifB/PqqE/SkfB family radical SAM enzyme